MKFLCPSCKAKYQIADEKVTGRSVRMKCRKCEYVIEIGKSVIEGAAESQHAPVVGSQPPKASLSSRPPDVRATGALRAGERSPVTSSARSSGPPAPGAVRSTGVSAAGTRAPSRTPTPPPRVPPARSAMGATPLAPAARPGPARPAPPPRTGAARTAAPARPTGATPTPALASSAAYVERDDKQGGSSALAGAFAQAVESQRGEALGEISMPADEWYVGINGVPVGPIRLSELRSKAAVGAVTNESLVWREGFEQWQPLKTFPELVAIVEESLSSARASLLPLTPPPGHTNGGAQAGLVDAFGRPSAGVEGFSVAVGSAPVTGPAVVTEKHEALEDVLGLRPRRTSMAAWIAVAVALLFGLTIGFVLFSRKPPPEPVVKYVEVPAKGQAATTPSSATTAESLEESTVAPAKPGGKAAAATPGKPAEKPPEKGGLGLSGLAGLQGSGPSGGPGNTESASTAGQPLDGTAVQRTVGRYTSSVRRSCWQPALDARDKDAPTSARVNVTITVSPGGGVQNVSTSGDPRGYRGLAGCIASRVRGWQFPASSGTTTVNVPFVFAAQ